MGDVLVQGPRRGGRRPPRWLLVLVAAAVVAGLVVVRAGWPDASTPPGPPSDPAAEALRPHMAGGEGLGPPGFRMLVGGPGLTVLDAGSGRLTPVRMPAGGVPRVTGMVPVRGGAVVVTDTDAGEQAADERNVYLVHGATAVAMTAALDVVPAERRDRFYGIRGGVRDPDLVEFDLRGRILSSRTLPPGWHPIRGTREGLLVHVDYKPGDSMGPLVLVDAGTWTVHRRLGNALRVVASSRDSVAWLGHDCEDGIACNLRVSDLRDRSTRTFPLGSRTPDFGEFSPDGSALALSFVNLYGLGGRRPEYGFVSVLDLTAATVRRLPGVSSTLRRGPAFTWSSDSAWLAVGLASPEGSYVRVGLWQSGPPDDLIVLPERISGDKPWLGLLTLPLAR